MKTETSSAILPVALFLLLIGMLMGSAVATAVEVGEAAPDFTLQSTTGKSISLSQFRGKKNVLIEFYSFDFNPIWTAGLKARMVDHSQFEQLDVQILAISGMNTFSQKMFAASLKLPYPLLSDYPDLKMIQHYDLLTHIGDARQPVAQGSYLLIDKQGIIRGKWLKPPGEVFPNDILLQAAREIAESL